MLFVGNMFVFVGGSRSSYMNLFFGLCMINLKEERPKRNKMRMASNLVPFSVGLIFQDLFYLKLLALFWVGTELTCGPTSFKTRGCPKFV